jgi:hypothetical protein
MILMELGSCLQRCACWLTSRFSNPREHTMKKNLIAISASLLLAGTAAYAQPLTSGHAEIMSSEQQHYGR